MRTTTTGGLLTIWPPPDGMSAQRDQGWPVSDAAPYALAAVVPARFVAALDVAGDDETGDRADADDNRAASGRTCA